MQRQRVPVLIVPLVTIILAILAAAGAALFMSVSTAHAEISGPCTATIAGVDVAEVNSGSRDDDIHVSQDDQVLVGALSPVGFQSHKIQLEFGSRRWTVSEEEDDGSPSWIGTVNVDDYATWGVGLYKVIGVSTLTDGTTCEGAATVDVDGNPLATVAGAIALGGAALGTLGAVASGARSALSPFGEAGEMVGQAFDTHQAEQAERDESRRRDEAYDRWLRTPELDTIGDIHDMIGCFCFAAIALILTPLMALTGGAAGGESGGPAEPGQPAGGGGQTRRLPRAPWRPRITLLGLVSGLLAGTGIVVLLQQYSIQYPTLGVIITWAIIGAVVYGLVLPTLGYTIGWLRINGRIARLEREIGWRE